MRRSTAPSFLSKAKRPRFSTPWATQDNVQNSTPINTVSNVATSHSQAFPTEDVPTTKLKSVIKSLRGPPSDNSMKCSKNTDIITDQSLDIDILKPPVSFVSPVTNVTPMKHEDIGDSLSQCRYYKVMWCKMSKKKHKTWEGDAVLETKGRTVILKDMDGRDIGKTTGYRSSELAGLVEGSTLYIGGKEIEIMSVISDDEWSSGRCFLESTSGFVNPLKNKNVTSQSEIPSHMTIYKPRHDPTSVNALVMPKPNSKHQLYYNTNGLPYVEVVIDPRLTSHLRPHQKEGVIFLYECVMDMKDYQGQGVILADEMGLGKSLQCITLVWTLLKQGPYGGKPVIRRVIIVTPGSLVKNWQKEFQKWLGYERVKVFAASTDNRPEDFVKSPVYPVLLISYELFMRCYEELHKIHFDIIICDEGHRLKNAAIKTSSMLSSLTTMKRIVLSGTPIQNDLLEFHAIVEFCNPGVLGSASTFKKVFEEPIVCSRQPDATQEERHTGERRVEELTRLTSLFCLRRTQEINNQYLPPKVENIIFCRPSSLQLVLYRKLLSSRVVQSCLTHSNESSPHLVCIGALKKLCNSPSLIYDAASNDSNQVMLYDGIKECFPEDYNTDECYVEHSGKLWVLAAMLEYLHVNDQNKIVLISNYTQTLDILQKLCQTFQYSYLRLDGQTPSSKRQQLVDKFNRQTSKEFVFLLSSKAGGVGLNLTGATHLILYDIDWNPANDSQAMARVWRDGQTNKVHIYRLLTTGSIEEKMFQRQVSKQVLSNVVDKGAGKTSQFTIQELKDLFSLHESNTCLTHEQLGCNCNGLQQDMEPEEDKENDVSRLCSLGRDKEQTKNLSIDQLKEWRHYTFPFSSHLIKDKVLIHASDNITFVMQNEITTKLSED